MSGTNARNVHFRKSLGDGGVGDYPSLQAFVERRQCLPLGFINTQVVSVSNQQFALLASNILTGKLGIGTSTAAVDGSISVSALPGTVGSASIGVAIDTLGDVWNMVEIRNATTHDPILIDEWKVYGLLHCANTVTDGDAVGTTGSENLQLDFVRDSDDGTLVSVSLTGDIEFQVNKVFAELNLPASRKINGGAGLTGVDIISPKKSPVIRYFTVTTAFAVNEVISLSTGDGAGSGVATAEGNSVSLPDTSAKFIADHDLDIRYNDVHQRKGGTNPPIAWNSQNSFHFTHPLDVGDEFSVEAVI